MKNLCILFISILVLGTFVDCEKEAGYAKGSFLDSRDGNSYKWVQIGDQIWMAGNLAYLPKVDLQEISSITDPCYYVSEYKGTYVTEEISETNHQIYRVTSVSEAKATDNYKTYGALYNWEAALIVCPEGWHLPSNAEWEQLAQYINEKKGPFTFDHYGNWAEVGNYLKAIDGWYDNGNGTNDFGFSALPNNSEKQSGSWWSSTESDYYAAFHWYLSWNDTGLFNHVRIKNPGYSVRCIKD